jgi:hypothetical protein
MVGWPACTTTARLVNSWPGRAAAYAPPIVTQHADDVMHSVKVRNGTEPQLPCQPVESRCWSWAGGFDLGRVVVDSSVASPKFKAAARVCQGRAPLL